MGNFSATYEGEVANDALQAAFVQALAAVNSPGQAPVLAGVGNAFLNNVETAAKHVKAKDAIQFLMGQGGESAKTAAKLQGFITKAVGIGDIGAVRLVSLSTEVSKTYNPDTTFLNLISPRRLNTVSDFTHAWREDDFGPGSLDSLLFDPNGTPAEDNGAMQRRSNTLAAIGGLISVGIVTNEMIKKRGFMDELERQVSDKLVKIRRSTNRQMLTGTENGNGPVFNMGGLIGRTTANVVTPGGGAAAVTGASIDTVVEGIITAVGNHGLVALAKPPACAALNALLQKQFPGSRLPDFFLSTKPESGIATYYFSPLVGPIPVYLDTQMPDNTLEIFCPEYVRPNGFTIGDVAGPWVIALAQTGMSEPRAIFDLLTLEDRVVASRGKVTNIL